MILNRTDLELEVIVNRIEGDEIDLQPDFQRGEVWNLERQRRLIDTVLRNWYVPPIHLIREPETGEDLVLDGQQRLLAILAFFRGELTIDGSLSPHDPKLEALGGSAYPDLPEELQRRARRFPLSVITLSAYEPEEPYELFFRLNQSMTLTPPEKRNALYGRAREQVKSVIEKLTEKKLLDAANVGFANRRLAYDDVLARFALTVESGTLRRSYNNKAIEEFYRDSFFSDKTVARVTKAAEGFLETAEGLNLKLNKATFLSWLVFTYSLNVNGNLLRSEFVARFEELRGQHRRGEERISEPTRALLAIYNDRASYRVNDTSSILLRDLTLHLLWSEVEGELSDRRLADITYRPNSNWQEGSAERALTEFLDLSGWDLP